MKQILFVLTLVLACTACRSTRDRSHAEEAPIESMLVQLDPRIVGSGSSRAVEFTLENTSERPVACAFTVNWFDAHGARLPHSSNAWQRVELDARASHFVRVAPMPSQATSWRLQLESSDR